MLIIFSSHSFLSLVFLQRVLNISASICICILLSISFVLSAVRNRVYTRSVHLHLKATVNSIYKTLQANTLKMSRTSVDETSERQNAIQFQARGPDDNG